jgi:REP element-mobilizing transposase RayT
MKYNPDIHHRRSIRLKGYDYSQEGLYFITICAQNRECLFGAVTPEMTLNDAGRMIECQWLSLRLRFPNIELHEYVVMPNHFHGILEITASTKNKTVNDMMDAFKSTTTVEYIRGVKNCRWQRFNGKLWQRDYWEHIIRNEQSLHTISDYIINNPANWNTDKLYKP